MAVDFCQCDEEANTVTLSPRDRQQWQSGSRQAAPTVHKNPSPATGRRCPTGRMKLALALLRAPFPAHHARRRTSCGNFRRFFDISVTAAATDEKPLRRSAAKSSVDLRTMLPRLRLLAPPVRMRTCTCGM